MKAGDIMTTGAACVHAGDSVGEAARIMVDHGVSGLPVVDAEGHLTGIVTERDLLRRVEIGTEHRRPRWLDMWFEPEDLAEEYTRAHGRKVDDVMSRDVVSIDTETPANEIVDLMEREGFKRLPVLRDGKVAGIVSRANLLKALSRRMDQLEPAADDDLRLRRRIVDEIRGSPWGKEATADVFVREGIVTLRGRAGDERVARAMRVAAENTPGVKKVVSHVQVIGKPSNS